MNNQPIETKNEKNAEIISRLVNGEYGKKVSEEIRQESHDKRLKISAQIEPLKAARKSQLDIYLKEVAKTLPRLKAAEAELKAAEEAHYKVMATEQQSKMQYSARSNHLQGLISSTAPKEIDKFIKELAKIETETRNTNLTEKSLSTGKYYPAISKNEMAVYSQVPSINLRLKAIRSARMEAILLKEKVLSPGELQEKLAALRDSLPAIKADHVYSRPDH